MYFIENMDFYKEKDPFFINSAFESILKNSLFQECIDFYQYDQQSSNIFENEYINEITRGLIIPYDSYSHVSKFLYENLETMQKLNAKAKLVCTIIDIINNNMKKLKTDSPPKLKPNEKEVENLLKECILISSESKKMMTDFFFDNFNFHILSIANKLLLLEELEKIISYMDFDYLIETYLRHNRSD